MVGLLISVKGQLISSGLLALVLGKLLSRDSAKPKWIGGTSEQDLLSLARVRGFVTA
jgi:hypothetical protein